MEQESTGQRPRHKGCRLSLALVLLLCILACIPNEEGVSFKCFNGWEQTTRDWKSLRKERIQNNENRKIEQASSIKHQQFRKSSSSERGIQKWNSKTSFDFTTCLQKFSLDNKCSKGECPTRSTNAQTGAMVENKTHACLVPTSSYAFHGTVYYGILVSWILLLFIGMLHHVSCVVLAWLSFSISLPGGSLVVIVLLLWCLVSLGVSLILNTLSSRMSCKVMVLLICGNAWESSMVEKWLKNGTI